MKYSNKELPHIWANQRETDGKGSNMFFEGTKIYSYGKHFCIAELFPSKGVVLFNASGYSSTTAKHKSYVRRAIPSQYKVIEVVGSNMTDTMYSHHSNMDFFKANYFKYLNKAATARQAKDGLLNSALNELQAIEDYAKAFGLRVSTFAGIASILKDKKNILTPEFQERIKTAKQDEQKRILAEQRIKIQKWIKGKLSTLTNAIQDIFLRVAMDGEQVETSKGARVTYQAAKVLYSMIKAGEDIKGFQIDGYTVIGINGTLKIGCHEIDRKEVERFAKSQKW